MSIAYSLGALVTAVLWLAWFDPWHESIRLPSWAPPSQAIRIGWVAGLASSAAAVWLVAGSDSRLENLAIGLLWAHLVTAAGWTAIFYRRRNARTGFTVICLHWTAAALAAAAIAALNPTAGLVVVPWLLFITYLGAFTFFVWQLEKVDEPTG